MKHIPFSILLNLPELLVEYALTDFELVDLSLGNDEQVYLLFAKRASCRKQGKSVPSKTDTRWGAIVLRIDWQTGNMVCHSKLDFGVQEIDFQFIQPIEKSYLLVDARSEMSRDGQYDENAVIVDQYGERVRSFCLGDGIQQCFVDGQNRILTSYFDEGVFGNHPAGKSGLVRWSSQGKLEWENPFCSICDCYAMNLDAQDNLWFYYYTDFELVKTDYEKHWVFTPGISGSNGFLLGQDGVSFLFQGGYGSKNYSYMKLCGASFARAEECILADPDGRKLKPTIVAFRKSIAVVLDDNGILYGTNWVC